MVSGSVFLSLVPTSGSPRRSLCSLLDFPGAFRRTFLPQLGESHCSQTCHIFLSWIGSLCSKAAKWLALVPHTQLWNKRNSANFKETNQEEEGRKRKKPTKTLGSKDPPTDVHMGKRIFQNQLLCPHYLDNCQWGLHCSPGPPLIVSGWCCHFVLCFALSAFINGSEIVNNWCISTCFPNCFTSLPFPSFLVKIVL